MGSVQVRLVCQVRRVCVLECRVIMCFSAASSRVRCFSAASSRARVPRHHVRVIMCCRAASAQTIKLRSVVKKLKRPSFPSSSAGSGR